MIDNLKNISRLYVVAVSEYNKRFKWSKLINPYVPYCTLLLIAQLFKARGVNRN